MIPLSQIFFATFEILGMSCVLNEPITIHAANAFSPHWRCLQANFVRRKTRKKTTLFDCFHVNRLKLSVDERCFTWSHTFHSQNILFKIFHLHTTSGPINIRMSASTHRTRAVYLRSWDKHWSILFMLWCHCNWLFDLLLLFSLLLLSLVLPFWPRFLFYIAVTHSQ